MGNGVDAEDETHMGRTEAALRADPGQQHFLCLYIRIFYATFYCCVWRDCICSGIVV